MARPAGAAGPRGGRRARAVTLPGMALRSRTAAVAVALLTVPAVATACSGSSGGGRTVSTAPAPSTSAAAAPTRWWSNSAVTAGSTIDVNDPTSAAAKLHPSKTDYCGMLKQTLDSGNSILPGITATDPALLTASKAFVAEIQQVAPADVTGSWQVLGPAILALVNSGGNLSAVQSLDVASISKAVTAVSDEAKQACGLDLSAITGAAGLGTPTK